MLDGSSLDTFATYRDVQSDVNETPRYRVGTDAEYLDSVRFDRCSALGKDVDDVHRDAAGKCSEKCIGRRGRHNAITVEKDRRPAFATGLESPFSFPVQKYPGRCAHFGAPFSIGARTELPHSVQLPS